MAVAKLGICLTSVAALAWTMQGCCCGVTPPKPGPSGSVSGQIDPAPGGTPGPLTVYAVNTDAMYANGNYVATHLPASATTYTLAVPPGNYSVVARLDGHPSGGAGYTFNVGCTKVQTCGGNAGNTTLDRVRVDSMQTVSGIDLGDWGTPDIAEVLWRIDNHGSPLSLSPGASPSAASVPSRPLPSASTGPSVAFTSSLMGLTLRLPATWGDVKDPNGNGYGDVYVANEEAGSPLELDSAGVWLNIEPGIGQGCPSPDWRYNTATATVDMQGGSNSFFFEDPAPRDGPQPFTGYSIQGGEFVFGNCIEFTLTGSTQNAFNNNLAAFAAIVQTATFGPICTSCPSDLHPATSA